MDAVFILFLNRSITAGWIALAVILLRLFMRRAPKWIRGILWGLVAIRLVFPFSLESVFSLIPSAETIPQSALVSGKPAVDSGFEALNRAANPVIEEIFAPDVSGSAHPIQTAMSVAAVIWIAGVIAMCIYMVVSFLRVRRKIEEAVRVQDGVWICDHIATPFIFGIFRPRIYVPSSVSEADMEYVIFHEKAHLKRKDPVWKLLGFLLLAVYWFHPLLWLSYTLLCRDIELACDEKVMRQLGAEGKKPYADALINCSVPGRTISVCPLAFGETGIKERVKSVLSYKNPGRWRILAAALVCAIAAVCLLTNPKSYDVTDLEDALQVFLNEQIVRHHQSEYTKDHFAAADYVILGVEESASEVRVYMWVLYMEYSSENGGLQEEAGAHVPTVITAEKNRAAGEKQAVSYELAEYWEPKDGELYEGDIKEKFPKRLWDQALNSQKYIEEQNLACLRAAREYYGISESRTGGADGPDAVATDSAAQVYRCVSQRDSATLFLEPQSRQFTFTYSLLSSYFAAGTYREDREFITAYSDDGKSKYVFEKEGENVVFMADKSSEIPGFSYASGEAAQTCLADGAVFRPADAGEVQPDPAR